MWENLDVLPRAFVVHTAESLTDDQALSRMQQAEFEPDQLVFLGDGILPNHVSSSQKTTSDQAVIAQYENERVVVKVKTDSPGYLVLTDSWYPGWQAWIDGRSAPILRADLMFRALALDPGEHTVVFEYHPTSLILGAAISGLSILVCGVLVFWSKKRVAESNAVLGN